MAKAFLMGLVQLLKKLFGIRDVPRDYLGIAVFIGRVTKREAEGIATLRSSDNIRHHNKIFSVILVKNMIIYLELRKIWAVFLGAHSG